MTMTASTSVTSRMLSTLSDWRQLVLEGRELEVDGRSLTVASLTALASGCLGGLRVSEPTREVLEENHAFMKGLLDGGAVIYGVNTGFGGSADRRCSDVKALQKSLISFLNAGFGEGMDVDIVRGAIVVRANSLSLGYSGVRGEVVELLSAMVTHDIVPQVPLRGSVNASGDLMPLSYVAACMMGRPDIKVVMKGEELSCIEAFRKAGLKFLEFEAKEALAMINSSSLSSSLAAQVLLDVSTAQLLTQIVTGLCMESLHGKMETFSEIVHSCLPHQGNKEVAANIRTLLNNSKLVQHQLIWKSKDRTGVLKQDRYALRTAPQWLGPAMEIWGEALGRVTVELNSANDNPLIDHRSGQILHCGNFQGTSCTVAMDQNRQAVQLCARLMFAQLSEVLNHTMGHDLPPNLSGADVSLDYGFKSVDVATASYMSELNHMTSPLTNHVLSAEMHNQSVNSLALISARTTRTSLTLLQMILCNALCALCQAIDLRFLQKQVLMTLDEIIKEKSLSDKLNSSDLTCAWYDLAFNPRSTLQTVLQNSTKSINGIQECFLEEAELRMSHLTRDLKYGRYNKEIAEGMGQSTRIMYTYIRESLGVPFHDGSAPLDLSLNKIYESITTRNIVKVIIECFSQ